MSQNGRPNPEVDPLDGERKTIGGEALPPRPAESDNEGRPAPVNGHVLTINEVAILLRLHPTTVYRLAKKGALPAFKIGSSWRFDSDDLNRWRGEQYRFNAR